MGESAEVTVTVPADLFSVREVEVVVAHNERATLRVGDVFLKIDADRARRAESPEVRLPGRPPSPALARVQAGRRGPARTARKRVPGGAEPYCSRVG